MKLAVVIPTVEGREEHFARCVRGYRERTRIDGGHVEMAFAIPRDLPTCGLAWQEGADFFDGQWAAYDYLHFTADDIVPGEGWLEPMVAQVERGHVPVARVVTCTPEVLEDEFPKPGNPLGEHHAYFEDQADYPEGYVAIGDSQYPSIPFCSRDQWASIGPMVASHYGTDKWFGYRAKQLGFHNVVEPAAVFYHYAAIAGRAPTSMETEQWLHTDRLDFDFNIAYPMYVEGRLDPTERHPLDGTDEGRALARSWRVANVPGPHPWEI